MKLNGKPVSGVYVETVLIPRPSEIVVEDGIRREEPVYHVFKLGAVLDYADFEKMCPEPEAPIVVKPGDVRSRNVEDKGFRARVEQHLKKRFAWAFLQSIKQTPELEWDTVNPADPETWENYEQELRDSGFSASEVGRLYTAFHTANGMNEKKLEEARKSFLQRQQAQPAL